jgi:phosphate transport system substrate-binding protein
MKRSSYFLFILLVVGFVACQRKSNDRFTDTLTQGVIPIAVDETFKPIIDQEISVFETVFPEAGIVPTFMSERDAVDLLLKDSVRLAITTRPLSAKEKAYLASKKFEPREYKLAVDGIALIVNKSNKDTLITVDQLRKILTGKITNWGEIHPGSNLGKINLVFDDPNSSTVRYAIDSICGGNKNLLSKNLSAQNSNKEVLEYVAKTSDAIGIIGVSWLSDTKDTTNLTFINTVRVMSVSNEVKATPQNSYKPYQAYLFYGDYPLTRNIFVILNDPRSSLPSGFTSFLTSDKGQRIILKAGLVPATQPIRIVNVKEQ